MSRWYLLLAAILIVAAASGVCTYIDASGLNLAFSDEYEFVLTTVREVVEGSFGLPDLFTAHNEHRYPILRGIFALSTAFDSFDTHHIKFLAVLWVAISAATLALLLGRERAASLKTRCTTMVLMVAALFSLRHWENWNWAMQNVIFLGTTFVLLAATLLAAGLARSTCTGQLLPWQLPAAIGCAVGATMSFGAGMALWPPMVVAFATCGNRRGRLARTLLGLTAMVGCLVLYFLGNPASGTAAANLAVMVDRPLMALAFFLASVGGSVVGELGPPFDTPLTIAAGGVLLGLSLYSLARSLRVGRTAEGFRPALVSALAILFGLLTAAMILASRLAKSLAYGDGTALAMASTSRYAAFTVTIPLGLLYALAASPGPRAARVRWTFQAGLAAVIALACVREARMAEHRRHYMEAIAAAARQSTVPPPELLANLNHHAPERVVAGLQILHRYRLNVFAGESPR